MPSPVSGGNARRLPSVRRSANTPVSGAIVPYRSITTSAGADALTHTSPDCDSLTGTRFIASPGPQKFTDETSGTCVPHGKAATHPGVVVFVVTMLSSTVVVLALAPVPASGRNARTLSAVNGRSHGPSPERVSARRTPVTGCSPDVTPNCGVAPKYPLTSITTWTSVLGRTHSPPVESSPTIAATARASPARKLRFEASGAENPHGKITMWPGSSAPTTVRFIAAAVAPTGTVVSAREIPRVSPPRTRAAPGGSRVS